MKGEISCMQCMAGRLVRCWGAVTYIISISCIGGQISIISAHMYVVKRSSSIISIIGKPSSKHHLAARHRGIDIEAASACTQLKRVMVLFKIMEASKSTARDATSILLHSLEGDRQTEHGGTHRIWDEECQTSLSGVLAPMLTISK